MIVKLNSNHTLLSSWLRRGRGWFSNWKRLALFSLLSVILCVSLGSCTSVQSLPETIPPVISPPPASSAPPATTPSPEEIVKKNDPVTLAPVHQNKSLELFYHALNQLNTSSTPVNILHLGDSHTAGDKFSGHLRYLFQQRFGSAGRGMLPAGEPFTYFRPTQVKVSQVGNWHVNNSFKSPGNYGLSGFLTISDNPADVMTLEITEYPLFEEVDLEFLRYPGAGSILVQVDRGQIQEIITGGSSLFVDHHVLSIPSGGQWITLAPKGDGPIELLSWSFRNKNRGILYHSHGIVGATVNVINQWNPNIVSWEIKQLNPALIIVAYGTNEGFNDRLKQDQYESNFREKIALLQRSVPQGASVVIVAPPDAQRLPAYCPKNATLDCYPLNSYEVERYSTLLAEKNGRLCRWHSPPMLNVVREIQRRIAEENGYFFWDWSQVMGQTCGTHFWVSQALAASDHVHLKEAGYQFSAEALFNAIMNEYH